MFLQRLTRFLLKYLKCGRAEIHLTPAYLLNIYLPSFDKKKPLTQYKEFLKYELQNSKETKTTERKFKISFVKTLL